MFDYGLIMNMLTHLQRGLVRASQCIPTRWHAEVVARAFNAALALRGGDNPLTALTGTCFAVVVEDFELRMQFEIVGGRLRAMSGGSVHVVFSGRLLNLAALASGLEDPDTLFFQRRVCVEGATDTGVHLKNALDALGFDLPTVARRVLPPQLAVAAVRRLHELRERVSERVDRAA
jgi:O2-independent ubiquinone biosynthesis accessory factor UbiT